MGNGYTPSRTSGRDDGATKRKDARLNEYAGLRKEGQQPRATTSEAIEETKRRSDATGTAHRADATGRMMQEAS